ncbi:MAG TPA: thioredoxin domain-containing protein, partial [Solirubrobacteraceae bacterium]|nr:thioredoxin domain-containing protein [Solirubrobacteraceae bacterium]
PAASVIEFLLRRGAREMPLHTLRRMASGGMYDQIGGGFARYAVDRNWTVPHFEKMLYDNALLARAYLHGWQATGGADGGDPILRRTAEETLDWALREMTGPEGAFYSALDADSEGVEGKFYVWSLAELREVLGDDAEAAIIWFGASERGNFEGANILESRGAEPAPEVRERIRAALLERRSQRIRPGLDDKRLTAWNALMISALAEAGAVLERDDYLAAARLAATFVLDEMRTEDGRLLRSYNAGEAKLNAYLEDHAFLLEALITLYEATFEARWFHAARELADTIIERFGDAERGGFFQTASDHEQLVTRRKEIDDSPIPSGQSSAAFGLLRLAALTGEARYEQAAVGVLQLFGDLLRRSPLAFGHLLQALDFHLATTREVAIVGADRSALVRAVRARFRPHLVLAGGDGDDTAGVPLLEGRTPLDGRAAAYVCERFTCKRPVSEPQELREMLGDAA